MAQQERAAKDAPLIYLVNELLLSIEQGCNINFMPWRGTGKGKNSTI